MGDLVNSMKSEIEDCLREDRKIKAGLEYLVDSSGERVYVMAVSDGWAMIRPDNHVIPKVIPVERLENVDSGVDKKGRTAWVPVPEEDAEFWKNEIIRTTGLKPVSDHTAKSNATTI